MGIGAMLAVMTNRLSRIVDRAECSKLMSFRAALTPAQWPRTSYALSRAGQD
jgi:hypothetical protein